MVLNLVGLCSRNNHVRIEAIGCIDTSSDQGFQLITGLLDDPCVFVRRRALEHVYRSRPNLGKEAALSILEKCIWIMNHEKEQRLRLDALRMIYYVSKFEIKKSTISLGIATGDPDRFVRELACKLLASIYSAISEYRNNNHKLDTNDFCTVSDDKIAYIQSFNPSLSTEERSLLICQLLCKEVIDGSNGNLPWCFCGGLVVALEDEYEDVRIAALEAMLAMCQSDQAAIFRAVPFLIDAVQDESSKVQHKALEGLLYLKINSTDQNLKFDGGLLQSLLHHLVDKSKLTRKLTRSIISSYVCKDLNELLLCIRALTASIQRIRAYGVDEKLDVCSHALDFGFQNMDTIRKNVNRVLHIDTGQLCSLFSGSSHVPTLDDPAYLVRLCTVIPTLHSYPSLLETLPTYIYDDHWPFVNILLANCPQPSNITFFGEYGHQMHIAAIQAIREDYHFFGQKFSKNIEHVRKKTLKSFQRKISSYQKLHRFPDNLSDLLLYLILHYGKLGIEFPNVKERFPFINMTEDLTRQILSIFDHSIPLRTLEIPKNLGAIKAEFLTQQPYSPPQCQLLSFPVHFTLEYGQSLPMSIDFIKRSQLVLGPTSSPTNIGVKVSDSTFRALLDESTGVWTSMIRLGSRTKPTQLILEVVLIFAEGGFQPPLLGNPLVINCI